MLTFGQSPTGAPALAYGNFRTGYYPPSTNVLQNEHPQRQLRTCGLRRRELLFYSLT